MVCNNSTVECQERKSRSQGLSSYRPQTVKWETLGMRLQRRMLSFTPFVWLVRKKPRLGCALKGQSKREVLNNQSHAMKPVKHRIRFMKAFRLRCLLSLVDCLQLRLKVNFVLTHRWFLPPNPDNIHNNRSVEELCNEIAQMPSGPANRMRPTR